MKIYLNRDYCGRIINDHVLLKGEQEVSPEVGNYLIDKGYATGVKVEIEPDETFDIDLSDPDFTTLTKAELMEILDSRGILYTLRDTKDELIALLESNNP